MKTITSKERKIILLSGATALLLLPLIAMQFTKEVDWSIFDFAIAAILLYGTALVLDLVLSNVKDTKRRVLMCLGVLLLLGIIWIELAVGIFGSPVAGS
jgi:hypothetical protein